MPLNLIQAGVGGHGRSWVNALSKRRDVNVLALVDPNAEALAAAGEALRVPPERCFANLVDAIDDVDADAVLTVTPPAVHVRHAELAFEAGLHVMTEKPIAGSLDDARRMVRLAKDAGRVLMVAQNYRYSAAAQTLIRLMREKPLGELGHGHIDFYIPADFPGTFRETMPHVLLVDMAIHHLDLVRAVTGRNITRVTAQSFTTPWSWFREGPGLKMLMTLDGNVPFSYSGDWTGRGRLTTWNGAWRLQCEHGCIELLHDGTIRLTRSDKWDRGVAAETVPPDPVAQTQADALLTQFVDACRTNTPPDTSGADNLWSFAAVQAGVQSAETATTVDVAGLLRG